MQDINFLIKAARFADAAHKGQYRKYTYKVPYIVHPGRVASRVSLIPYAGQHEVAVAWLHDVLEDSHITFGDISDNFYPELADDVMSLTNPSKKFPHLKRFERKEMDRKHIAKTNRKIKIIKMIDRTDNLRDLSEAPVNFIKLYYQESLSLFEVLRGIDNELEREYMDALSHLLIFL